MKGFKNRLAEIMAIKNVTKYRLATDCNISPSTVANWLTGKSSPDKSKLNVVAKYLSANIEWLINGEGGMLQYHDEKSEEDAIWNITTHLSLEDVETISNITSIPVERVEGLLKKIQEEYERYNADGDDSFESRMQSEYCKPRIPLSAAAGTLTSATKGVTLKDCEQLPIIHQLPDYDFTIPIKGDSLYPKYESGDEVACKRVDQTRFLQWGKLHVLDTSQGVVIKRIYEDGDKIRCVSYNPEYPDFSIDKNEIYSINLVVGLIRI